MQLVAARIGPMDVHMPASLEHVRHRRDLPGVPLSVENHGVPSV
jgi:hypothetical protein